MMPKTVGDLFRYYFKSGIGEYTRKDPADLQHLIQLETRTTCGWACLEATVRVKDVLKHLDNHHDVRYNILKGLVAHLEIMYFGYWPVEGNPL